MKRSLGFSYRLLFRSAPWAAVLLLPATLLIGMVPGLQAWLITSYVETLQAPDQGAGGWFGAPLAFWGLVVVGLTQMAVMAVQNVILTLAKHRVHTAATESVLNKSFRLSPLRLEQDDAYDRLGRAKEHVQAPLEYVRLFQAVLTLALSLGSFLVYVWSLHPWLSAAFAGSMLVYAWLMRAQSRREHRLYMSHTQREREADYLAGILSHKQFGKEVRTYGNGKHLLGVWQAANDSMTDEVIRVRRSHVLRNFGMTSAGFAAFGLFFVTVAYSVANGMTTTAAFAGLVSFIGQLGYLIANVGQQSRDFQLAGHQVEQLMEYLDLEEEPLLEAAAGLMSGPGVVELRNASFRYPGADRPSLSGINLRIQPGETVAIVGENGAGKSTLAYLLAGYYSPTEGDVLWDGMPYEAYDPAERAAKIGMLHQKPIRYELSLAENIELERKVADDRWESCLARHGLEGVVQKLPAGRDTQLGRQFGEVDLSGGEWQRVAMARTDVRDPMLFLLDEPTSALDPVQEAAVLKSFYRIAANKSTVIISHRLGSTKEADRIVVLKDGRIVESGAHPDLMRADGEYARLYRLQAQWYEEVGSV